MDPDTIERMYIDDKSEVDLRREIRGGGDAAKMLGGWDSWERCGFRRQDLDVLEDVAIRYLRNYRPP